MITRDWGRKNFLPFETSRVVRIFLPLSVVWRILSSKDHLGIFHSFLGGLKHCLSFWSLQKAFVLFCLSWELQYTCRIQGMTSSMFHIYVLTTAGDIFSDQTAILIFFSLKDDITLLLMHNLIMLKQQNLSIKKCSIFPVSELFWGGGGGNGLWYISANLRFVLLLYSWVQILRTQ